MGWLSDLIGGATTGLIPDEILNIYQTPIDTISPTDVTFKPYSVTSSGLGTAGATSTGSTYFNLSPQQQALQNQLFGGAQKFYTAAMGDTGAREQDVYNRIRSMQQPEEQRQAMALEERLFNQGRGGVATNQYGGTPEQLAMQKARAEAMNSASLSAMQQAQQEQQQNASLASGFMQQGYAPTAQLMNMMQTGANNYSMFDVINRQNAANQLQADLYNSQTALGQQQGLGNLYGGVYGGLLGGLGGLVQGAASGAGGLLTDWIRDKLGL